MGKTNNIELKSQLLKQNSVLSVTEENEVESSQLKDGIQQVVLQQSVTILAFKDKTSNNATSSPDLLEPKLFFGFSSEDIPLVFGALIGAAFIIVSSLMILTLWKCCCRMKFSRKKKEYSRPWNSVGLQKKIEGSKLESVQVHKDLGIIGLNIKDKENTYRKSTNPAVVSSNSVVFLGLKSSQVYDSYRMEKSSDNCCLSKPVAFLESEDSLTIKPMVFNEQLDVVVSAPCSEAQIDDKFCTENLPNVLYREYHNVTTEPTSISKLPPEVQTVNKAMLSQCNTNIPSVVIHCDDSLQPSLAFYHQPFHSGNFDQRSLCSCESHLGSEIDLKTCSLTWSNYSLRPLSTGDCYYDLFQRASFCKKRKNRMRSDIAAAIAMNRSQSTQMNKDTESLFESEVEIVLNERTTL